jgi:hypothetical protein
MPHLNEEPTPRQREVEINVRFERINESTIIGHGITKDLNPEDEYKVEAKFKEYLVKEHELSETETTPMKAKPRRTKK